MLITFKPASAAASSEPGSEISSFMDSGDDLSETLVTSTTGPLIEDLVVQNSNGVTTNMAGTALPSTVTVTALPLSGAALPLTPSTIQSIVVPLSIQDTPSVAGPLISMPHAAMQPTAMPLLATPSRPNQMSYCRSGIFYMREIFTNLTNAKNS